MNKLLTIPPGILFLSILGAPFINMSSCGKSSTEQKKTEISSVIFTCQIPVCTENDTSLTIYDSLTIYYYKNYVLCTESYQHSHVNIFADKNDSIIKEELALLEFRTRYYLYEEGNKTGLFYETGNDSTGVPFSVDSFYSKKIPYKEDFLLQPSNDSLVYEITDSKTGYETKKYIPKTKPDWSYNDTTILTFFNLPSRPRFSLSKKLDSSVGKRLCRAELLYIADINSRAPCGKQRRAFIFAIAENKEFNKQMILEYFNRFKRDNN